MQSSEVCSEKSAATQGKKKYSREELFKLAKRMHGDGSLAEDLERLESSQYDVGGSIDRDAEDGKCRQRFNSVRSVSALGRQRSELGYEFNSLIDPRNINNDSRRTSNTITRVSRMISSPSFKYNKKATSQYGDSNYDGISVQARAKYEKLVESCSNSTGQQPPLGSRPGRQNLARTISHNSWLTNNGQHQKSIERPTHLFGPLRREVLPRQSRRSSEDSQSLPYFSNTVPAGTINWSKNPNNKLLTDDFSASPITRISAADKSPADKTAGTPGYNEDDDFDITSLVSITVLSDIKTIRPTSRPLVNLAKQAGGRVRAQETSMRPLNRARTATDLTYNGRHSRETNQKKVNQLYFSGYRSSGAESLAYWPQQQSQHSDQVGSDRGFVRTSQQKLKANNKEIKDSTQAKIIEMFKVQVMERARAKEPVTIESNNNSNNNDATRKKSDPEANEVQHKDSLTNAGSQDLKRGLANEVKVQASSASDACACTTEMDPRKSAGVPNVSDSEIISTDTVKKAMPVVSEVAATENLGTASAKSGSLSMESKPVIATYTSNIPRLICLHKAKLTTSLKVDETLEAPTSSGSTKSHENLSSPTKKPTTKFVSQYKQLRGKSLADEVKEVSK